jgi:hypothetical protein
MKPNGWIDDSGYVPLIGALRPLGGGPPPPPRGNGAAPMPAPPPDRRSASFSVPSDTKTQSVEPVRRDQFNQLLAHGAMTPQDWFQLANVTERALISNGCVEGPTMCHAFGLEAAPTPQLASSPTPQLASSHRAPQTPLSMYGARHAGGVGGCAGVATPSTSVMPPPPCYPTQSPTYPRSLPSSTHPSQSALFVHGRRY